MSQVQERRKRQDQRLRDKEMGFDLSIKDTNRIPEYNSLVDPKMCHFFENRGVQSHLMRTGQIDLTGRVVSLEKNKFKLNILEKEFSRAEMEQKRKEAEEEEIRHRIQRKRILQLERARKEELITNIRKDKAFSKSILETFRPRASSPIASRDSRRLLHSSNGKTV